MTNHQRATNQPMTDPAASGVDHNPDQQMPMPFAVADVYALLWLHK
jgi:hypothetical protein